MKRALTDPWFLAAVLMLLVWAVVAFALEGPGWIHALLTLGVSLLIYRIVVWGTPHSGGKKG